MVKAKRVFLISLLLCWLGRVAYSQESSSAVTSTAPQLRIVVSGADVSSDSMIVVPPLTSRKLLFSMAGQHPVPSQESGNLAPWIDKEAALNGLQSLDLRPWHIVIVYDQFDEDGDNVHSGVLEELWAAPKKYRISYTSDNLNQTDYGTEKGLFRLGDQRWPSPAEIQIREEVVEPFSFAATLKDFHATNTERSFGIHKLDCVLLEREPATVGDPSQYCFEHGGSVLRYSQGTGWHQTTYNDITSLQGRNIAREVEVTDAGKPYLRLVVKTLERIPQVDENDFLPPPSAVSLQGKRQSGVILRPVRSEPPEWPNSLRSQHFSVMVEIVTGKDGHVVSAHAVSGPLDAYKSAKKTARKWIFQPYLVLGEPAEVESRIILSNN